MALKWQLAGCWECARAPAKDSNLILDGYLLECAGINRHGAEDVRALRERSREQSTMLGILRGESPRAANRL
jgi:hypothetical protein